MMEAKGPVKAEWNTSSEQGGAVEMHVMERKPAWSQFAKWLTNISWLSLLKDALLSNYSLTAQFFAICTKSVEASDHRPIKKYN